jgi:hypothetical protein
VILNGDAYTTHTNNADIWVSQFRFTNSSGNAPSTGTFNSPRMTTQSPGAHWSSVQSFSGPLPFFTGVRWTSHC